LRFRSKPLVALSIVLVLASSFGGWHAPDDSDEYVVAAVHQHADHDARFAAPASPFSEHCAFCHWLRAFRNGAPAATDLVAAEPVQFIRLASRDGLVRTASRLALPSRAPPLV
jgi:mono/diheme cytochrome c family protein